MVWDPFTSDARAPKQFAFGNPSDLARVQCQTFTKFILNLFENNAS